MADESTGDRTIIRDFIERYRADEDASQVRSLTEYQALFPGDDLSIAACFAALRCRGTPRPSVPESRRRLASYELIREIGRGGQAVVYLARDVRLDRTVAVKILEGMPVLSGLARGRFEREARVASRIDHPGICGVYEAGVHEGVPYIAMRHVAGESLAQRLSRAQDTAEGTKTEFDTSPTDRTGDASSGPLGPRTRGEVDSVVRLIEKAARAVHAAHAAGVIHRDLKPGNIMIAPGEEPVILDFGLGRLLEEEQPTLTRTGDLFGTPAYMSPEQITSQAVRVDARTDIWSLGVCLYEALTLRRPFQAPTREGLYQAILGKDPPDPRRRNPAIPKDVATVIGTALEKDRDRRYQSAEALAGDLEACLARRPVAARPAGPLLRLRRWSTRNPAVASAILLVLLVVLGGIAVVAAKNRTLASALEDSDRQRALKTTALEDLAREGLTKQEALEAKEDALKAAEADRSAKEIALRAAETDRNEKASAVVEKETALRRSEGLRLAATARQVASTDPGLSLLLALESAELTPGIESDAAIRHALRQLREIRSLPAHPSTKHTITSRDGHRFLSIGYEGVARVWDVDEAREVMAVGQPAFHASAGALSPDGSLLAAGHDDGTVSIHDVIAAKESSRFPAHSQAISAMAFLQDRNKIATASDDRTLKIWDLDRRVAERTFDPFPSCIDELSTDREGRHLLASSHDRSKEKFRLWEVGAGTEPREIGAGIADIRSHALSPSGGSIAFGTLQGKICLWDSGTGQVSVELEGHQGEVTCLAWSPSEDGILVSAGFDGKVRLWETATKTGRVREVHRGPVTSVRFCADGRGIGVGCPVERELLVGDVDGGPTTPLRTWAYECALSADGLRAVSIEYEWIRFWNAQPEIPAKPAVTLPPVTDTVCLDPTATWCAVQTNELSGLALRLIRVSNGETVLGAEPIYWKESGFDNDGRHLAAITKDGSVVVWDTSAPARKRHVEVSGHKATCFGFAPDGRLLVVGYRSGDIRVWDLESVTAVKTFQAPPVNGIARDPVSVQFTRDGETIFVFSEQTCFATGLREPRSSQYLLFGRDWRVQWACLAPSGTAVVGGESDGAIRIRDLQSGMEIRSFNGHRTLGSWVPSPPRFSRDGKSMATMSYDGVVFVWSTSSWTPVARIEDPADRIVDASFDAAGTHLVTLSQGGFLARLPVDAVAEGAARRPREFSLDETEALEIGTAGERKRIRDLFDKHALNSDLVPRLHAEPGLRPSLRRAALGAARIRSQYHVDLRGSAENLLGQVLTVSGDVSSKALALLRAADALKPDDRWTLTNLGYAHRRAGDWPSALECHQRARDLPRTRSQNHAPAWDQLFMAECLHHLGRKDEAMAAFESAERMISEEKDGIEDLKTTSGKVAAILGIPAPGPESAIPGDRK